MGLFHGEKTNISTPNPESLEVSEWYGKLLAIWSHYWGVVEKWEDSRILQPSIGWGCFG